MDRALFSNSVALLTPLNEMLVPTIDIILHTFGSEISFLFHFLLSHDISLNSFIPICCPTNISFSPHLFHFILQVQFLIVWGLEKYSNFPKASCVPQGVRSHVLNSVGRQLKPIHLHVQGLEPKTRYLTHISTETVMFTFSI